MDNGNRCKICPNCGEDIVQDDRAFTDEKGKTWHVECYWTGGEYEVVPGEHVKYVEDGVSRSALVTAYDPPEPNKYPAVDLVFVNTQSPPENLTRKFRVPHKTHKHVWERFRVRWKGWWERTEEDYDDLDEYQEMLDRAYADEVDENLTLDARLLKYKLLLKYEREEKQALEEKVKKLEDER